MYGKQDRRKRGGGGGGECSIYMTAAISSDAVAIVTAEEAKEKIKFETLFLLRISKGYSKKSSLLFSNTNRMVGVAAVSLYLRTKSAVE